MLGHQGWRPHDWLRGRRARVTTAVVSVAAIASGIALAGQIAFFLFRSATHGAALVHRARLAIAASARDAATCQLAAVAPTGTGQAANGLLEVPALKLVAPVLQGTGDPVLSDAVGHVPASAWPGQPGTSVLSAHDVTWFSGITRLRHGDKIRYVTPCRTYAYTVTSHAVVTAGYPVRDTDSGRLVLDTCYPLDALYVTSTRYLVYAALTGSSATHPSSRVPQAWPAPAVPAPAALAAQGLSLARNHAPLGTLRITGKPSPRWRQSSAPLQAEAAALAEYFGLVRSARQHERAWWHALAPAVRTQAAGALWGGEITRYDSSLSITLRASGSRVLHATLAADVSVAGHAGTGSYRITVTEMVRGGTLLATRITIRQVAGKSAATERRTGGSLGHGRHPARPLRRQLRAVHVHRDTSR